MLSGAHCQHATSDTDISNQEHETEYTQNRPISL